MPRYMIQGSYTREGIQGVLKEGGSGRKDAIGKMLADMGGSLESFYFAFGEERHRRDRRPAGQRLGRGDRDDGRRRRRRRARGPRSS